MEIRKQDHFKKPLDENSATHLIRNALGGCAGGTEQVKKIFFIYLSDCSASERVKGWEEKKRKSNCPMFFLPILFNFCLNINVEHFSLIITLRRVFIF